jgi:hypothetical protein
MSRQADGNLGRALYKVENFADNYWGGYLTPSEVLALLNAGAIPTQYSWKDFEYFREKKAKGDCRPTWWYFNGSTRINPLLADKPRRHRHIGR